MTLALLTFTALAVSGCQQQKVEPVLVKRWDRMRSDIKARLAADRLAAGQLDAAAGEVRDARRLDPENPDLVLLDARVALAQGRVEYAERVLAEARGDAATRAQVAYLQGVIDQNRQRWDEALLSFQRASGLHPGKVEYLLAEVEALLQLGRSAEALERLRSRERDFGWMTPFLSALAECHEQLDAWADAAATWRRVTGADTTDAHARARLALALHRAGQSAEAVTLLDELCGGADATDVLRLALAACLLDVGQAARAAEHLMPIVQADPSNRTALVLMARAHAAQGRLPAALRVAQRVIELDSQGVSGFELAAALALRLGELELARDYARRALRIDPAAEVALRVLERVLERAP